MQSRCFRLGVRAMQTRSAPIVALSLLAALTSPLLLADDDRIAAKIKAAGGADKYNADVVVVLDETDVTVQPSGIGAATYRRVVKILRDGGSRSEAVQQFTFDPTTNVFEPKSVRVYRAGGKIEDVSLSDLVVQPETQWGIFWGSQQALISVPRLEVGDAVATEFVKTGFNVAYLAAGENPPGGGDDADRTKPADPDRDEPLKVSGSHNNSKSKIPNPTSLEPPMPGHWFDEVSFWSSVPVIEKRYIVRVPRDKTLQFE